MNCPKLCRQYKKSLLEVENQILSNKLISFFERSQFCFCLNTVIIVEEVDVFGYDEASLIISEYINFYNNYRIQTKTKLTPLEKRNQFVA